MHLPEKQLGDGSTSQFLLAGEPSGAVPGFSFASFFSGKPGMGEWAL